MSGLKIKKDDLVQVIAGKDKGKQGKVLRALPSENKVVVEGINIAKKAVRPTQQTPRVVFLLLKHHFMCLM